MWKEQHPRSYTLCTFESQLTLNNTLPRSFLLSSSPSENFETSARLSLLDLHQVYHE